MKAPKALVLCAVLLSGCATKPKTYQPPDASKVVAAQKRYVVTVNKARELAASAHNDTIEARDAAMRITLIAGTASKNLNDLLNQVPESLKGAVRAIITEVDQLTSEQNALVTKINGVIDTQTKIETQFEQAERDKQSVLQSSEEYFRNAQSLADDASSERSFRIKAEQSLHWYRMHWWGSWIALGLGVIACLVLAVLKFTGRLAIKSII